MDGAMQINLRCPRCPCCFSASPDTPADEIIERMIDEGPWYALAEGSTFEDMIFAALLTRGRIGCPDCGKSVAIVEESLAPSSREEHLCR
jgi:hypothetical protein